VLEPVRDFRARHASTLLTSTQSSTPSTRSRPRPRVLRPPEHIGTATHRNSLETLAVPPDSRKEPRRTLKFFQGLKDRAWPRPHRPRTAPGPHPASGSTLGTGPPMLKLILKRSVKSGLIGGKKFEVAARSRANATCRHCSRAIRTNWSWPSNPPSSTATPR